MYYKWYHSQEYASLVVLRVQACIPKMLTLLQVEVSRDTYTPYTVVPWQAGIHLHSAAPRNELSIYWPLVATIKHLCICNMAASRHAYTRVQCSPASVARPNLMGGLDNIAGQDKPHTLGCIQLDGGIFVIISQLFLISYRILYHKCFLIMMRGKEASMASPLWFRCGTAKLSGGHISLSWNMWEPKQSLGQNSESHAVPWPHPRFWPSLP